MVCGESSTWNRISGFEGPELLQVTGNKPKQGAEGICAAHNMVRKRTVTTLACFKIRMIVIITVSMYSALINRKITSTA